MPESPTEPEKLEAILLIPGFTSKQKNFILYQLGQEFEKLGAESVKNLEQNNFSGKQFKINNRLIDVYEAYWGDLIEDLTKMELTDRIPRGAYLLYYWLVSGIYQAVQESILLVLSSTVLLLILVCWYFITILLVFSQIVEKLDIEALKSFKSLVGWIWLINTFLVGLLPVGTAANLINFSERYFEDDFTKYKINERVSELLNLILEKNYSNVTVLAHSFGAIIGTNLLAKIPEKQHICYITLGSPLKFFSFKSSRIKHNLFELVDDCKGKIDKWIEYYSEQDPLCIKMLPVGKYNNLEIKTIQINNSQGKRVNKSSFASITGLSHNFYFYNQEIVRKVLKL